MKFQKSLSVGDNHVLFHYLRQGCNLRKSGCTIF